MESIFKFIQHGAYNSTLCESNVKLFLSLLYKVFISNVSQIPENIFILLNEGYILSTQLLITYHSTLKFTSISF